MDSLNNLYQELIIDHSRHPHNYGKLPAPALQLEGFNPLCGDRFMLYVELADPGVPHPTVKNIKFAGQGCAISTASTSILTDLIKGHDTVYIYQLIEQFQKMVTLGKLAEDKSSGISLGKASALAGVIEFPMRVKCATLSWHTLHQLLTQRPGHPAHPLSHPT